MEGGNWPNTFWGWVDFILKCVLVFVVSFIIAIIRSALKSK